jgi:PPK2 family polyphosphate:nucleotide phosphotransferase
MSNHHLLDHASFLVPPGKKIRLKDYDPGFTDGFKNKEEAREALLEDVSGLAAAQDVLWAAKEHAVIILFQALDAAGKDGTIKHVMSGVNPQGVFVRSFKSPSSEELLHHYLWRPMRALPARGEIAIFNRSYYEEVLVVRVHPEFLAGQWLPEELRKDHKKLWKTRYAEMNRFESVLKNENNTTVIKFFLNVSKSEQRDRFLERLDNPEKNWKFSRADLQERRHWDDYQHAYEDMLEATSTDVAPWYVIPADKKWFTRACVADIITRTIEKLKLKYPTVPDSERAMLADAKTQLEAEEGN